MSLFDQASLIVTPNAVEEGKLFSIKPTDGSGDLDVVRATTKTRVNSLGVIESVPINVAALDYTNGSCPSILVEPQRTNLLLRSEEFDNGYWGKTLAVVTPNSIVSPSGNLTADKIESNSLLNLFFQVSSPSITRTSTQYSASFFFKNDNLNTNDEIQFACLVNNVTNEYRVRFNPTTMEFKSQTINGDFSNGTYQVIPFIDGWFRVVLVFTISTTPITFIQRVVANIPNQGLKSFYLWGAQLEAGSNATSYIPTVASTVTRNADVISKTGISDLIGQTEGTIFVDYNKAEIANTSGILEVGSANNEIQILQNTASQIRFIFRTLGISYGSNVIIVSQERLKICLTYQSSSYSVFLNGVKVLSDISVQFASSYSGIVLGNRFVNTAVNSINSGINLSALWKTSLTDQECINLTTL